MANYVRITLDKPNLTPGQARAAACARDYLRARDRLDAARKFGDLADLRRASRERDRALNRLELACDRLPPEKRRVPLDDLGLMITYSSLDGARLNPMTMYATRRIPTCA